MKQQSLNSISTPQLPSSRASPQFERDLIALVPYLRAFARTLCRRRTYADDLAQEALAKAWRARDRFEPGTNLKAWLFTILRNEYFSNARRAWREMPWKDELELIPAPLEEQEWAIGLADTARALAELPVAQREAVVLVAAGGFSYDDAAKICGTPVGSIKSRVARGRASLLKLVDGEKPLKRRSREQAGAGMQNVLAQLTALMPAGATNGTHV